MSYNIAAGRRASAAISAAQRNAFLAEKRAAYAEYRAEARACGQEVESFEEYIGERDPRADADERQLDGQTLAEWWHNADLY